jgi:hypothetical protein
MPAHDAVYHPAHYTSHPSGIETIEITEHMNFCLGNVIKYVMRAEHKGRTLEDLKKARWYLDREIQKLENNMLSNLADLDALIDEHYDEFDIFN